MRRIAVFDFDGTLTRHDTLIEFIRFTQGTAALYWGLLLHLPWLILMKLHLYDNGKTKERVFSYFFKGMSIELFNQWGEKFYEAYADRLLYKQGIECINRHKAHGDKVIILSASLLNWVNPFADALHADALLSTEAEVCEGKLTGKFATKNCYGEEKVRRLTEWLPTNVTGQPHIIAYGDSRGDKELLQFANESYYKPFKK